jgi:hypothetical protein
MTPTERVALTFALLLPLTAACATATDAPSQPAEAVARSAAALAGPPAVGPSTTWVATSVFADADAFTLVDLGGTVYAFGRGLSGKLQAAPNVASAFDVPNSPTIVGDGISAAFDPVTSKVFVAVRTPSAIRRYPFRFTPSHIYLAQGSVSGGVVSGWTWSQLGSTDAPVALTIACNQVKIAARYSGATYTGSLPTSGGAFSGWTQLATSSAGRPVLATNSLDIAGLALVGDDHRVTVWGSACNPTFDTPVTIGDAATTTNDDHVAITALGPLFGVGIRDQNGFPRFLEQSWSLVGPSWTGAFEDVDAQTSATGLTLSAPIAEPPVLTTFRGLTFMAARDPNNQMLYWVRSQNAIDMTQVPTWHAWVGGRVVSGWGTGATPPALIATGRVDRSSVGYGTQKNVQAELYVATRGIGDKQLYALNMGRFATLDVLEGIYNLRVDTGYWEASVAKNTVPNLFDYFIGWMATPSTLWAPLSSPTTCALATDTRGASIYPTQAGGEGVEGCYVAQNGFPSTGGITVNGSDGSAMRVWEEWGHEFLWKQFDMSLFADTKPRLCNSNVDCGTIDPTGVAVCRLTSLLGFGNLVKSVGNVQVCAMPDKYTGGFRPQGFATDYSTTSDYHNMIYVMLMYRWFGEEMRAMAAADAAYGDSRLQQKYNFIRDNVFLGHEYLGTRDLANAAATGDETVGKIMTPLL